MLLNLPRPGFTSFSISFQTSFQTKDKSLNMKFDHQVNACGLLCPLPLLKSKRQLNRMEVGEVLMLIATDPNAEDDLKKFCGQSRHEFLHAETVDDELHIFLQKK
ncbi:MAG: hypothetical protein DRQ60_03045 [Gammaproteobacteria bacterium]|nr:MAG: hypothetical protein DRQ52_08310 [Gammaproteobacteria bacterium]RLA17035.1 MAG: hypothetical protein DRQ60_03045 [Gammaproteobacteria bacterium]